ncbi:hypothetical protein SAMD00024442_26_7 [Candidatus Symbiothrix dinenymphae]|nr:hypothetical protein SAMD00024442_26_7 [Candidatus Symbiothrix dinenymphae]
MKKKFYLVLALAVMSVVGFTSCSASLPPLPADAVSAVPQPLELVGGQVPVTINVTFPAKWFVNVATLEVTPVLRYEGGEAVGTPYTFQGEKVKGNGQVIPQSTGGPGVLEASFPYVAAMRTSTLWLTFKAKVGSKAVDLPALPIGNGVLSSAALLTATTETPSFATQTQADAPVVYNADLLFLIQKAELRASELKKAELADWSKKVKDAGLSKEQTVDVEISAYASPDGGFKLNDKLAAQREVNTNKYLAAELKKNKVTAPITAKYTAQDWDGFKELVQKSNLQDKDLILRVLSMYSDTEQREREIKNISAVYSTLAEEILPQLRRSRLSATVRKVGKTDAQIASLASSNPQALTADELLTAGKLAETPDAKATIYKKAIELFPNDARAYNNAGVLEYQKGNISGAGDLFKKAVGINGALPEANLNLAYVALANGDRASAGQYLAKASGAQGVNNAQGLVAALDGNYAQAKQSYGNTVSNNAALTQILSKDYAKAGATLNAVAKPDATTDYLKAIVGARTNNASQVTSNLKSAISKDSSLADKALNDLEFAQYVKDGAFLQAIGK